MPDYAVGFNVILLGIDTERKFHTAALNKEEIEIYQQHLYLCEKLPPVILLRKSLGFYSPYQIQHLFFQVNSVYIKTSVVNHIGDWAVVAWIPIGVEFER